MPVETPVLTPKTDKAIELDQPWDVIVYDDPVNLMQYVTKVLMKVFGHSEGTAQGMMLEVHNDGRSIVWSGGKERAELYVQQLHEAQLTASMEKSKDS